LLGGRDSNGPSTFPAFNSWGLQTFQCSLLRHGRIHFGTLCRRWEPTKLLLEHSGAHGRLARSSDDHATVALRVAKSLECRSQCCPRCRHRRMPLPSNRSSPPCLRSGRYRLRFGDDSSRSCRSGCRAWAPVVPVWFGSRPDGGVGGEKSNDRRSRRDKRPKHRDQDRRISLPGRYWRGRAELRARGTIRRVEPS
jgi:hypothetical protein